MIINIHCDNVLQIVLVIVVKLTENTINTNALIVIHKGVVFLILNL